MREIVKPGLILFIITAVAAVCLGFVYDITKEPIKEAEAATKAKAMSEILPSASEFKEEFVVPDEGIDFDGALVTEALTGYGDGGITGYIISAQSSGYGGTVGIIAALDQNGSVVGISVIKSSETAGLGANASKEAFTSQFKNKSGKLTVTKSAPGENEIVAITSATITSRAVTNSVNAALSYYAGVIAKEGR